MRVYEATYILNPELDEERIKTAQDKFSEMVVKSGGEIVNVESWGKRKMAYEIGGFNEGVYVIMKFNSENQTADTLRRNLNIADEVLRSLLIRLN